MNSLEVHRAAPRYELKDDLARLCLPSPVRDANLKLAWVNSICLLFLLIGLVGARRGAIFIKAVPPIHVEVPVVVQPAVLPPQAAPEKQAPQAPVNNAPRILVALPNAPNINFGVPTEGTLVVPVTLASPKAQPIAPVRVGSLFNTGAGGERPDPPYPKIAEEQGEQGTIVLSLAGDDAGNVISVEVKSSSGYPVLDRATLDFVKRHWHLPNDSAMRQFETTITYKLVL